MENIITLRENSEDLLDVFGFLNTDTAPADNPEHPYYRFVSLEDEYSEILKYYSNLWKKEISLTQFLHQDLRFVKQYQMTLDRQSQLCLKNNNINCIKNKLQL